MVTAASTAQRLVSPDSARVKMTAPSCAVAKSTVARDTGPCGCAGSKAAGGRSVAEADIDARVGVVDPAVVTDKAVTSTAAIITIVLAPNLRTERIMPPTVVAEGSRNGTSNDDLTQVGASV